MSRQPGSRRASINVTTTNIGKDKVVIGLTVKQNFKKLRFWYALWQKWQRRIVICRVIEHCSSAHLNILATSLEPVLHLDYTNSLSPLMAALHYEGSQMFKIRRSVAVSRSSQLICTENHALNLLANINDDCTRLIPTTLSLNKEYNNVKPLFLPSLPVTHFNHKPTPSYSDIPHLPQIERKFNSVPNIPMAINTKYHKTKPYSRHHRSLTYNGPRQVQRKSKEHQKYHLELFKTQLNSLSKWMTESSGQEIVYMLLELIKLCDKDLTGYLVQCVYQKIQTQFGLDSFSDHILLKIFSYLDARSVCNCAMVCQRWYSLTSKPQLWRGLCSDLGYRESLGNLVAAIEGVHEITQDDDGSHHAVRPSVLHVVIDWKQAFRDLTKLMSKIKAIVLKKAQALAELAEQKREAEHLRNLTSAQLRTSRTLREMLDIVRNTSSGRVVSSSSTQEVLLAAPESASALRRRLKKENVLTKQDTLIEVDNEHTTSHEDEVTNNFDNTQRKIAPVTIIELLEVAIDRRPSVPSLPNPEGIECLVLAGYLSPKGRPRPGRVESLPSLERIAHIGTAVLCLQCDERKIVAGCSDRLIRVYDIRSGRPVSTLSGHKGSVQCLQFDDNKIVSGSWDTTCIVWDVVHFTSLKVLSGHVDCVSCLQFNENILVSGCYDQTLKIWEVVSWLCLRTISMTHTGPITCLFLNGYNIISGSEDRTVKLWSVNTGECQGTLTHTKRLTSLKLSKLLLVTSTVDGIIHLWNINTQTELMKWTAEYGDKGLSSVVDIAIDKGKIYAARIDGVIHEWDIATGACVRLIQGHSKSLTSIWVGNSKIVSAGEDQTLCVWQPDKFIFQSGEVENFYSYVPIKTLIL